MRKGLIQHIGAFIDWLRYPVFLGLFLVGILVLLLKILPSFDNSPDQERFFATQNPVLHVFENINTNASTQETITVLDKSQKMILNTKNAQNQEINFGGDLEFRFASKTTDIENFAILERSEGSQFFIFPQSDFVIKQASATNGAAIRVEIKQGDISVALSSYAEENKLFDLDEKIIVSSGNSQLEESFIEKKRLFFVEEAGGVFLENATLNKFVEYYLTVLFNLDAERFGQKLLNFQEYQKYLETREDKYYNKNYSQGFSKGSVEGAIQKRGVSGWEQTKLKQRLDGL